MNVVPGTVNLDPDGVNSLASPRADALCFKLIGYVHPYMLEWPSIAIDVSRMRLSDQQMPVYIGAPRSDSAPKWSPTPPTKDGWYWMKEPHGTSVVKVERNSVLFVEQEYAEPLASLSDALWYGPFQEPTE